MGVERRAIGKLRAALEGFERATTMLMLVGCDPMSEVARQRIDAISTRVR